MCRVGVAEKWRETALSGEKELELILSYCFIRHWNRADFTKETDREHETN